MMLSENVLGFTYCNNTFLNNKTTT